MKVLMRLVVLAMCLVTLLTVTASALTLTEFQAMLEAYDDDQDAWRKTAETTEQSRAHVETDEKVQFVMLEPEPTEKAIGAAAVEMIVIEEPEVPKPQTAKSVDIGAVWVSSAGRQYVQREPYEASQEEILMLAALIHCEARGEPYDGQVAVGAVVISRVRSGSFPNTIAEVILQNNGKTWQFTPVMTGVFDKAYAAFKRGEITQSCMDAAVEALSGATCVGDRMYFKQDDGSVKRGLVIGGHVFY